MNFKFKIWVIIAAVALIAASCNKSNSNSSNTGNSGNSSNNESNSSSASFPPIDSSQQHVVTYSDSGFSPATLTITQGDTVAFENNASDDMHVASNPHPIHNGYPTTGGCISSTFDSCGNIPPGHMWTFEFGIVGSWGYHNHDNPSEGGTIVVQSKPTSSNTPGNATSAASAKNTTSSSAGALTKTQTFTVNANDNSADLANITVNKGDTVKITFNVLANETYHGGLDFRSSQLSTGTIAPGSSKTITFTASGSFAFTPYWPATNIEKPYKIQINVS